jgi:hypothetical protein
VLPLLPELEEDDEPELDLGVAGVLLLLLLLLFPEPLNTLRRKLPALLPLPL